MKEINSFSKLHEKYKLNMQQSLFFIKKFDENGMFVESNCNN